MSFTDLTPTAKAHASQGLCDQKHISKLIDRRRAAAAIVAGLDLEICMALGDRDGARRAMKEMNAQTTARQAVQASSCFFDQVGEIDAGRAV